MPAPETSPSLRTLKRPFTGDGYHGCTQRMDINLGTSLVVIIHKVCVKALLTVRIWSYDHNLPYFPILFYICKMTICTLCTFNMIKLKP